MPEPKRRRGHGEGTGGKRKDGRWEWRATMPDGRRRSFYGPTRTDAKAKADAAIERMKQGIAGGERLTVAAYLAAWLSDTAAHRVRPTTLATYQSHIETHITPAIGKVRLLVLTPQHVNRMLTQLVDGDLAGTTVNRIRAVLVAALADAVKTGLVGRNVASLSQPRKEQRKRHDPLTLAQARALIAGTRDHRFGPLWHLAIATGARQGELRALTWADVNLETGILHIRHTMTRYDGAHHRGDTKTDESERAVKLTPDAIVALERQRRNVDEWEMLAAHRWQDHGLVFPSTIGTPLFSSEPTAALHDELERLGLPDCTFHDLRHCYATLTLSAGVDLFTVSKVLGHKTITQTSDTYGHLTHTLAEDAAARLGAALAGDAKTDARPDEQRRTEPADRKDASDAARPQ